jgi:hypothetical protein
MSNSWKAALVAVLVSCAALPPAAAQQAAPPRPDRSIDTGRLIDGVASALRERVSILIAGDRIVALQDGIVQPAGAKMSDLSAATVLPELFDSHTQPTGEGTADAIVRAVTMGPGDVAVRSTVHANVMKGGVVHRGLQSAQTTAARR